MNNLKESMMPISHLPKLNFAILATTILLAGCGGGGGGGGSMDPQIAPREVLTPVIEVKAVGNGVVSIGVGPNTTGTNKATCTSGTQTVSGTGTDNDSVAVSGLVNGQQYDCSVVVVSRDLNQYKDSAASNSVQITPIAIAGSEALQTRTGQFIDSPVAGLGYRTATLSGLTDAEGKFKYLLGEQVAFSINGQPLGSAFAQAMVQISDVTANGFTTPIAAASLQIAQLLQSVDTKVSKEVITIDSAAVKALSIPKFDFGVASSEFVETFTRSLPSQFRLVSDTAAQLHVDQYLATVSTRYDDACGTPRRVYTIGSVTDESKVAIDTASSRFNCSSRGQIVAFTYLIQPWLSSKLATINSQSTVFDDTAQNEQVLLDASSNKNWLQISVKTIGYAAEALDAAVKINDSKTTTIANVTNILATAGLKIVDKYVQTNSASKEDKDLAQRRIKLAQKVISLAATIVECKQANDKIDNAKACAKVLTSAMRVLEQEFKFVVDDDPEGLLAVQAMGSTLTLVLSLENANANPIKMQAAVAEYTAEMLRVAGTYMINVRLPADSTWGAVIESMLAESSSATKAYFDCKAVAFGDLGSLRNCWDGTIPRLTDNLAKAVFRGGLS